MKQWATGTPFGFIDAMGVDWTVVPADSSTQDNLLTLTESVYAAIHPGPTDLAIRARFRVPVDLALLDEPHWACPDCGSPCYCPPVLHNLPHSSCGRVVL